MPKAKAVSRKPSAAVAALKPVSVPSISEAFGNALVGGMTVGASAERREPPITVECRVKVQDANSYHILVASDKKVSKAHWEIFTMKGSGELTVYLPGATPDHVRSKRVITDDQWHAVAMQYDKDRVRLWVNGQEVSGGTDCNPATGYLCLESEGSPVEFKNLRVRLLP